MASANVTEYWCHQCEQATDPIIGEEILCSRCNGEFVEEIEPPPRQQPQIPAVGFMDPMLMLDQRSIMLHLMQTLTEQLHVSEETATGAENGNGVVVMDPLGLPLLMFQGLGGPRAGASGLELGDYFIGPGLEQLIQRLAENDPNRYGTPPAAKEAVEGMPTVKITEEHLKCESQSECAVCKEDFVVGEESKQLPCKHLYHGDCILPWLKLHSSCPVCRFQMPVEEGRKSQAEENTTAGGGGGSDANNNREEGNGNNNSNSNRWLRISVPFSMISNLVTSALGSGNHGSNQESNESNGHD